MHPSKSCLCSKLCSKSCFLLIINPLHFKILHTARTVRFHNIKAHLKWLTGQPRTKFTLTAGKHARIVKSAGFHTLLSNAISAALSFSSTFWSSSYICMIPNAAQNIKLVLITQALCQSSSWWETGDQHQLLSNGYGCTCSSQGNSQNQKLCKSLISNTWGTLTCTQTWVLRRRSPLQHFFLPCAQFASELLSQNEPQPVLGPYLKSNTSWELHQKCSFTHKTQKKSPGTKQAIPTEMASKEFPKWVKSW